MTDARRVSTYTPDQGIAALPGFAESLRLLITEQGYALTDVALMFGVSRERVRQLCDRLAIPRRHGQGSSAGLVAHCRVWDDATHRFVPVPRAAFFGGLRQHRITTRRAAQVAMMTARHAARMDQAVAVIHALRQSLGRTPTILEVTRGCGLGFTNPNQAGGALSGWLEPVGASTRVGVLPALWRAAGVTPRPIGGAGRLTPRPTPTACRHGHPRTPENWHRYPCGTERCRPCETLRRAQRRARARGTCADSR